MSGIVIIKKRKATNSTVERSNFVKKKRVGSISCVVVTGRIEQHRCSANRGIVISGDTRPRTGGEGQRSSANTGVEAGITG